MKSSIVLLNRSFFYSQSDLQATSWSNSTVKPCCFLVCPPIKQSEGGPSHWYSAGSRRWFGSAFYLSNHFFLPKGWTWTSIVGESCSTVNNTTCRWMIHRSPWSFMLDPQTFSALESFRTIWVTWGASKTNIRGFPGGAVVENLPANAGDTGSSPGLGRSHMPRSNWAREPQLLSLHVWSLCFATGEAAIVRGPHIVMKSGSRLPQLEKALTQKRRPNTAKNKKKIK